MGIISYFNSRPSARGDPSCVLLPQMRKLFQFTPLREGRPHIRFRRGNKHLISIHAPPRGATHGIAGRRGGGQISIHAPPRGATARGWEKKRWKTSFQFTPLREGRQRTQSLRTWRKIFQFTPLREGRQDAAPSAVHICIFQFTPLREGRPFARLIQHPERHFNSRPSARGDAGINTPDDITKLFQFTPLREGRRMPPNIIFEQRAISIHAPPRGATPGGLQREGGRAISIHAPPRGATHFPPRTITRGVFQFTPLREGRPDRYRSISSRAYFNSRPSARGDQEERAGFVIDNISIHAPPRGATSH